MVKQKKNIVCLTKKRLFKKYKVGGTAKRKTLSSLYNENSKIYIIDELYDGRKKGLFNKEFYKHDDKNFVEIDGVLYQINDIKPSEFNNVEEEFVKKYSKDNNKANYTIVIPKIGNELEETEISDIFRKEIKKVKLDDKQINDVQVKLGLKPKTESIDENKERIDEKKLDELDETEIKKLMEEWIRYEKNLNDKQLKYLAKNSSYAKIWLTKINNFIKEVNEQKNIIHRPKNIIILELRLEDINEGKLKKVYDKKGWVTQTKKCENHKIPEKIEVCNLMIKVEEKLNDRINYWKEKLLDKVTEYIDEHWENLDIKDIKKLKEQIKDMIYTPFSYHINITRKETIQDIPCLAKILNTEFTIKDRTEELTLKLSNLLHQDAEWINDPMYKYLDNKMKFNSLGNLNTFRKECFTKNEREEEEKFKEREEKFKERERKKLEKRNKEFKGRLKKMKKENEQRRIDRIKNWVESTNPLNDGQLETLANNSLYAEKWLTAIDNFIEQGDINILKLRLADINKEQFKKVYDKTKRNMQIYKKCENHKTLDKIEVCNLMIQVEEKLKKKINDLEKIGGKKKKILVKKIVRKHRGIIQTGGNKGRLRKGYKYTGKKLKNGLPQITKCKINKL